MNEKAAREMPERVWVPSQHELVIGGYMPRMGGATEYIRATKYEALEARLKELEQIAEDFAALTPSPYYIVSKREHSAKSVNDAFKAWKERK